jgi:hypothetical protein
MPMKKLQEEAKHIMMSVSIEDLPLITIDKEAPLDLQVSISCLSAPAFRPF